MKQDATAKNQKIVLKTGWDYRAYSKVQRWICKECGKMTIQNEVQT